jgi:hypothetical protein
MGSGLPRRSRINPGSASLVRKSTTVDFRRAVPAMTARVGCALAARRDGCVGAVQRAVGWVEHFAKPIAAAARRAMGIASAQPILQQHHEDGRPRAACRANTHSTVALVLGALGTRPFCLMLILSRKRGPSPFLPLRLVLRGLDPRIHRKNAFCAHGWVASKLGLVRVSRCFVVKPGNDARTGA